MGKAPSTAAKVRTGNGKPDAARGLKSAKDSKSVKDSKSAKPTKSAKESKPAKSAKESKPAKSAKESKSVKESKPAKSVKESKSVKPAGSVKGLGPGKGKGSGRVEAAAHQAQSGYPPPAELVDLADPAGRPTRQERRDAGVLLRDTVPLASHADWTPAPDRTSPIELLEIQAATRVSELVPIRYGRMMASPFPYYRGTPIVMASDLARTPQTGVHAQICGDAHLMNFGLFATPERNLIFDVNDFDETLPGPWEWDIKRLAASVVVAALENAMSKEDAYETARRTVEAYARWMGTYAEMSTLDLWYSKVDMAAIDGVLAASGRILDDSVRHQVDSAMTKATHRTNAETLPKLTEVVDGRRRLLDNPPLINHLPRDDHDFSFLHAFQLYRESLRPSLRVVLDRFAVADVARKVVGVGSVGTRCYVVLMLGIDGNDPLFLQVKEAEASVLERHLPRSEYGNAGQRVVVGQRIMQAASDMFLGWTVGPEGRHFYIRQLRDMKGSARADRLTDVESLSNYGALCAWTLARGHAVSGDHVVIAGYLGDGGEFSDAVGRFAVSYAEQNERDYDHFVGAINNGRLFATPGY